MKKQLIIIGTIVLLVCVGLSGCSSNSSNSQDNNRFIGSWVNSTYGIPSTYTFFNDGTCSIPIGYMHAQGTYTIEGNQITFKYEPSFVDVYKFNFSSDGNTLYLTKVGTEIATTYTKT